MSSDATPPKSIDEIKGRVLGKAWRWFRTFPLLARWLLVVAFLMLVFVLARLHLAGDTLHQAAHVLVPWRLSWLDPPPPAVPVTFSYEVENAGGRRQGKLGSAVQSGDTLVLTFRAGSQAWLTVFGVDRRGIHPVFGDGLDPKLVQPKEAYAREFELDGTLGPEIYYAVAAGDRFDFASTIQPHLDAVFPDGRAKGPVASPLELKLPPKFTEKMIFFQHIGP